MAYDDPLYAVWRLNDTPTGEKGDFLFVSDAKGVEQFLWLDHREAVKRFVSEVQSQGFSDLFGCGRFRGINARITYWGERFQLLGE